MVCQPASQASGGFFYHAPFQRICKTLVDCQLEIIKYEDNAVSAANKARRMLFYLKRYPQYSPLYKTFIRPHLEYAIQATHLILCRDAEALEKVQKLALKFVKVRHVSHEAALKQLRQFSLTHRRIRGDLIAMFKITHGLLGFPMASTFAHPTNQGLRGIQVQPTEMLDAPSPIRLYNSGCPILEQTTS